MVSLFSSGRRTTLAAGKTNGAIADAVKFARERLGFEPDPEQERALRGGSRGIVLCSRQWGKSTVMAAKAVHRAWSEPRSLILLLSPCLRQSGEFLKKAEEFARRLGMKVRKDGNNERSILFPNESRIWDCRRMRRRFEGSRKYPC